MMPSTTAQTLPQAMMRATTQLCPILVALVPSSSRAPRHGPPRTPVPTRSPFSGEAEEEALTRAFEKLEGENLVRVAIENGMSTVEAFRTFGVM